MGQEAVCRARFEGRESEGKAKLESADLRFAGDFRFTIPFREMRAVRAEVIAFSPTHTALKFVLPLSAR